MSINLVVEGVIAVDVSLSSVLGVHSVVPNTNLQLFRKINFNLFTR